MRKGFINKYYSVLVVLLLLSAWNIDFAQSETENQIAKITLTPGSQSYSLNQASLGKVHFMAELTNKTDEVLVIVHPLVTYPEDYMHGDEYPPESRHGLAEILLNITQPSGESMMLREGGRTYFEPGNMDYLYVLPKSSKSFYVGWFFQNSKGRWEDDNQAWKAFGEKGTYEVEIIYRNFLPKAAVRTNPMQKAEFIKPWNGEILSETITIEVK